MSLHTTDPAAERSSLLNLRQLLLLRAAAIVCWIAAVAAASHGLHTRALLLPAGSILAAWAAVALLSWRRAAATRPVSPGEFFLQLSADVAALTLLLYFTGGSTNPFTMLYLLPLTVSAALLPSRYTWTIAGITAACYTALLVYYVPLPLAVGAGRQEFDIHVLGMWSGFMLSAGSIAYFVVKMGQTLHQRDRVLAGAREQALRDERLVALGTLAAGAAHELGTPLSTMAVIAAELARDYAGDRDVGGRVALLRRQIDRCKETLSVLSASAGEMRAEGGCRMPVDRYLQQVLDEWRATRPAVKVDWRWHGGDGAPCIVAERTLTQAIMNVLNNAADASAHSVEVTAGCEAGEWHIEVSDRGAGVSAAASARAGKALFTTKKGGDGLGLGLFLAHSIIGRFGGSIRLYNRDGGGACTRIVLPLTALAAP